MHLGAFYPYARNHNGKGSRVSDAVAAPPSAEDSKTLLNICSSSMTILLAPELRSTSLIMTHRPLDGGFQAERSSPLSFL